MPDTLQSVFDLPEVSFIDNDTVDAMMNRMVSNFEKKYKEVTGKSRSLAPADPMRILIYSVALDLYQLEMYTDRAGKQDQQLGAVAAEEESLHDIECACSAVLPSPARGEVEEDVH